MAGDAIESAAGSGGPWGSAGIIGLDHSIAVIEGTRLQEVVANSVHFGFRAQDGTADTGDSAEQDTIDRVTARVIEELGKLLAQSRLRPELKTAAELFEYVSRIAKEEHQALQDREVKDLARAIAQINRNEDPLVYSRDLLKENARQRARLLESWPTYNSRDLTQLAGHKAKNSSATASRWRHAKRVFAVSTADGILFPAFQFTDNEPHQVVEEVLQALPSRMSNWEIAFWFTSPNGYLDGACPAECFEDRDAIVGAARYEAERLAG